MSKIRIKNFGPIKEGYPENDGFIDIKKVTVFIGNQGSGKSTVAKLISCFTWLEKALNRGDGPFDREADIVELLAWHRLRSYFQENSEIEYVGEKYKITYKPTTEKRYPIIRNTIGGNYIVPQIMYIPAERNLLSTVKRAFDSSGLPGPLSDFAVELKLAQYALNGLALPLPFKGLAYEYDEQKDISYVVGKGYKIELSEASSGFHSFIPMFLVSRYLGMKIDFQNDPATAELSANQNVRRNKEISAIMGDKSLTGDEKSKQADEVFAKYHNKCFINIIEEPEQNLFPASQKEMLNSLIAINNLNSGNKLIMTTHSPYLISYLTLAVEASNLLAKIKTADKSGSLDQSVAEIVPLDATIAPDDLAIYEMNEQDGSIKLLGTYEGLPSDENMLNEKLGEGNDLFVDLLEIENKIKG